MVRKPTWQLPSPTRGITHTTPNQFDSTARARTVAWTFLVANAARHPHGCLAATTATKHTRTIKPIAPPLVIATTAPPALAQQHTLVAQTQNDFTSTPAFPPDLVDIIKSIREMACTQPQQPNFFFELRSKAAKKNFLVLKQLNMDLGKAITAQQDSPLGYGSKFKPLHVLRRLFLNHPLWEQMETILVNGLQWPLTEITEEDRMRTCRKLWHLATTKGHQANQSYCVNSSRVM